jgi:hypothetical protein
LTNDIFLEDLSDGRDLASMLEIHDTVDELEILLKLFDVQKRVIEKANTAIEKLNMPSSAFPKALTRVNEYQGTVGRMKHECKSLIQKVRCCKDVFEELANK